MATSNGTPEPSHTRFFWDDASIKNLLVVARQYQLSDVNIYEKQRFFYDVLEQGMQQLGYQLNKVQVHRKWKGMRERYYYIKAHPHEFPQKSKWEYMNLMQQLLAGYPQIDGTEFEVIGSQPPKKQRKTEQGGQDVDDKGMTVAVAPTRGSVGSGSPGDLNLSKETEALTDISNETEDLADKVNNPNHNIGEILDQIVAGESPGNHKLFKEPPAEDDAHSTESFGDDTYEGELRPSVNAEVTVNGKKVEIHGENCPDPLRPRRRRKRGETNTDRIIQAMEAEGEKDRKILLQFMNEFSASAAALTEAIKQITSHCDDTQGGETSGD